MHAVRPYNERAFLAKKTTCWLSVVSKEIIFKAVEISCFFIIESLYLASLI